jgi:hypothetical protein
MSAVVSRLPPVGVFLREFLIDADPIFSSSDPSVEA